MSARAEWAIKTAKGFRELGSPKDALWELEGLPIEDWMTSPVVRLRMELYAELKRWPDCADAARLLIESRQGDMRAFLLCADATRRCCSLEDARVFLVKYEKLLGHWWSYRLMLARIECQLGELDSAKANLMRAIRDYPECRARAVTEPDLEPLRSFIEVFPA